MWQPIVTGANCDRTKGRIVTASAATIVTALGSGPCTARQLSQRLDGITYANIRQTLRRLAAAGVVTNPRRGIYAVDCDTTTTTTTTATSGSAPKAAEPDMRAAGLAQPTGDVPELGTTVPFTDDRREKTLTPETWAQALADMWAHFHAMNDQHDERAWGVKV